MADIPQAADQIIRPAVDLGPYIGAVLIGSFISLALWGVALMQTLQFFLSKYPGDTWRLKLLVIWTMTCDTVTKCLIIVGGYRAIVSGEAMNPTRSKPRPEHTLTILITGLVCAPVQLFFAWRIWRFRTAIRYVFVSVLIPGILYHLVMSFYLTVAYLNYRIKTPTQGELNRDVALASSSLSVEGLTDIILSVGLCTILWRTYLEASHSGRRIESTFSMVRRLMLMSVNTGVWTAVFGLLTMTLILKYPNEHYHIAVCFIISPVYCIMLLVNLNTRAYIRDNVNVVSDYNTSDGAGFGLKDMARNRRSGATTSNNTDRTIVGTGSPRDSKLIHVTIETTTHSSYDGRDVKDIPV